MTALEDRLQQAVSALKGGRGDQAAALCRAILQDAPKEGRALNILAALARQGGRPEEAERLLRRGLAARPDDPQLLNNLASLLDSMGEGEAALALFTRCLAAAPDYASGHANLGIALERQGRATEAIASHEAAVRLNPDSPQFRTNLANALRAAGRRDEAISAYRTALAQTPRFLPAVMNLAGLLRGQGEAGQAMALYREALEQNPREVGLFEAIGSLLMEQGELNEAEAALRQAVALAPQSAAQHRNLGLLLFLAERREESAASLGRALALDPQELGALITLGQVESDAKNFEAAVAHLEAAVALAPDHLTALVTLLKLYQRLCRWAEVDRLVPRLDALERAYDEDQPGELEPPLCHITRVDDGPRNLLNAQRASARIERRAVGPGAAAPRFAPRHAHSGRLRIGYLSRDYRDHPVGHLIRGLFAAHDRADFEVHAYSYGPDDASPYRRAAESESDHFVDIAKLSHREAARRIHDDGIDILVDLAGHTNLNRLEICALRPAPLQATYLGFPGGSGAGFFDYLIGDPTVTPPAAAGQYREALAVLPHAYQINDREQAIAAEPASRAAAGLPEAGFVFACFNQPFKFDAEVFTCWMRLLHRVPGALLWLFDETGGLLAARLRDVAGDHGVAPERLVFAPRLAKPQHLARLAQADLMLDTRLYNGHTTTSDALFAGLPLITMIGRHFASRVSASLLGAVGLPELVTETAAAYEELAADLALDPAALAGLRARLAAKRLTAPLFDTALTSRHLEAAYRAMWETHEAGEPPRQIIVTAMGSR